MRPKSMTAVWRTKQQSASLVFSIFLLVLFAIRPAFGASADLLHNSQTTGSAKWSGKWGTAEVGAKYGEFTCGTCHDRNSTNVKRLRTSIATPDGTNWFGANASSVSVTFLDARNGTSHFGDDDPAHATSNRICEVCHSQTSYHRYNQTLATHYNQSDCTSCHKHNRGFKASCSECHGGGSVGTVSANFWPDGSNANAENTAGRHAKHMEILASRVYGLSLANLLNDAASAGKQRELCSYCHDTPGSDTDHGTAGRAEVNDFYTLWSKGVDNGSWEYTGDGGNGTCAATDCHNNKTTPAGYSWYGAAASTCTMCHTAGGGSNDPTSGLHDVTPSVSGQRHDQSVTGGCADCHAMAGKTTHYNGLFQGGNGEMGEMGLSASVYTQTADNTGTCVNTNCHLDGAQGSSDDWAHKWDSSANYYTTAATACRGCHGDLSGFNAGVDHLSTAGLLSMHKGTATYECQECHAIERAVYPFTFGTADWAPLNSGNKHGNGLITMNDDAGGTYTNWQRGTGATSAKSTCYKCHTNWSDSSPQHWFTNTSWTPEEVAGGAIIVSCGGCHNGGVTRTGQSGAHAAHNASSADVLADSGADCAPCHTGAGSYTNTLSGTHGDGSVTLGVTYSQAGNRGNLTGTCSNATCHYSQTTPAWDTTGTTCTSCHNDGSVAVPGAIAEAWPSKNKNGTARSDAHQGHVTTAMIALLADCTDCHGDNNPTHSNAFDGTVVYTGTNLSAYNTGAGTCTNTCHTTTVLGADFRDKTPTVACLDCHAATYIGSFVTSASSHTDADGSGATYTSSNCEACHGTANNAYRTAHADGTSGANDVEIPTTYGAGTLVPTMNRQYAATSSKIRLGGTATSGASYTGKNSTEAELCWTCHEVVTSSLYTLSGLNVTFTAPATIGATGIGNKFAVGRWITIFGSSNAANNRTFKVATSSANSITVTIPTGAGNLVSVAAAAGVTIVSPISEWQVNESSATGTLDYDYGMLFTDLSTIPGTRTSNWVTGYWRSGKGLGATGSGTDPFWYKRGALQSTHTANPAVTDAALTGSAYKYTETRNNTADIRCSYCHDVHGTHDGTNGDGAGAPYLRGTWKGNPYPEDGAPQWGMASWLEERTGLYGFGNVPRASAHVDQSGLYGAAGAPARVGGFWIDQNSGNPNSSATATGTSGLCDLCHGAGAGSGGVKDGTWTAAEIGAIDEKSGEGLWVSGFNGHANVVIDGSMTETGTNLQWNNTTKVGRNIFNRTVRGSSTLDGTSTKSPYKDMGLVTTKGRGYSYRSSSTSGYLYYPRVGATDNTSAASRTDVYAMYGFVWDGSTTPAAAHRIASGSAALTLNNADPEAAHNAQANYHNFNCAKCHNPHASRLPKLMITNCLDTNHNTWDNGLNIAGSAIGAPFNSTEISQWGAAQNCHRVDMDASRASSSITRGAGWNKVTPWLNSNVDNRTNSPTINP